MKNLIYFGNIFITLWFIVVLLDVPSVDAQSCDPLCKFPHKCQADIGKCLCVVGFTGPNAFYIERNQILADFCNRPCFYNIFFQSSECAATTSTTTSTTTTTSTSTTTPSPITNTTAPRANTTVTKIYTTMPKANITTTLRTNITMPRVNSTMPRRNFTNFTFPNINVTVSPTQRNFTNFTFPNINVTVSPTQRNFTNFTFPNINVTVSPTQRNGSIPLVPALVDKLCRAIEQLQYVKNIFQKLFG